jgi:transcriptional regulator with XRE-family HTH domain
MDISTILKERRATLNISQLELSEMAGVSLATIKDLERGLGNPSLKTLERIAVVLGLELTLTRKQTF